MKTHWYSRKYMMRLPPRSKYSFQMFKVTPFLVLKDLRKLNTTIQLIRSHIELNSLLRLRTLSKDSEPLIATLTINWIIQLRNLQIIIESENMNPEEIKKIPFLIEEMTHNHACTLTLMKTTISLYLRSQNC